MVEISLGVEPGFGNPPAHFERRRKLPGDDLLSGLATDTDAQGRMAGPHIVATAAQLLFAGHETTMNLLGNGILMNTWPSPFEQEALPEWQRS